MNYLDIEMARIRAEEIREQSMKEGKIRRALAAAAEYNPRQPTLAERVTGRIRSIVARLPLTSGGSAKAGHDQCVECPQPA